MISVGIRSLAVSFPSIIRTNDYYRDNYPELIAQTEQKTLSKMFSANVSTSGNEYEQEMAPYLSDPFRGTVERRILAPGETSLTLLYHAACDALDAAKLSIEDIDLLLVASLFPEQIVPGDAAFLSSKLGFKGAAWNFESTCSNAVVGLQTACSLVKTGEYHNVLVAICTAYSPFTDPKDTLSFLSGDGAGACIVSALKPNQGILGTKIINTAETCGTFFTEFTKDEQDQHRMFIRAGKGASKMFSETAGKFVRECCEKALVVAGVTLDQIDFFACNTPSAWYASACARAIGIDLERTSNLNSLYGNIGPVFPFANLYHAAHEGKIRENDLVLVYTIGSVSNAGATVMRWGDVVLGPAPASPVSFHLQEQKTPVRMS
jgi:3-oxoacyl-[acyl-carrier-protein] synthase-3